MGIGNRKMGIGGETSVDPEIREVEAAWDVLVREPGAAWGRERRIQSFEDLDVWQECRALRRALTQLALGLPSDEKFRLSDQIIRAARSATSNIAEGYGRFTYKDNIHFCRQSRGSLYELINHLTICLDERYLADEDFRRYRSQCQGAIRLLNGYIRFLNRQSQGQPPNP